MIDIDEMPVDAIANEMDVDVDVFHPIVRVWVVRANDGTLIVAS